jgi:signal transduction histidine kinase
MARDWLLFVVGFALFIVACGSTHLMDVVTTWIPVFWIDAWSVILTAILSAYVAVMLIRRANHISFAINDYTGRLAATEQEKLSMRDKLLAARKLEDWSKMSAVIAHEIANPLESIQNVLFLIAHQANATSESVKLANLAREEVGRVITLTQSTLSFHRESLEPEMVSLYSVAESVRFLLQGIIQQKHIDFQIVGDSVQDIESYPGETRQVVLNLARNACEATVRNGSRVILHLSSVDGGVELQVMDEGPGIDRELLPHLFEFGRSSKGADGNGIGLWAVKQIVSKHGGHVSVDPNYQAGARFVVWWPTSYRREMHALPA